MRLYHKVLKDGDDEKYIILFKHGEINTPLAVFYDFEWKHLIDEVNLSLSNTKDHRED